MSIAVITMRVKASGEAPIPERHETTAPGPGWVRCDVAASGMCSADIDDATNATRDQS